MVPRARGGGGDKLATSTEDVLINVRGPHGETLIAVAVSGRKCLARGCVRASTSETWSVAFWTCFSNDPSLYGSRLNMTRGHYTRDEASG